MAIEPPGELCDLPDTNPPRECLPLPDGLASLRAAVTLMAMNVRPIETVLGDGRGAASWGPESWAPFLNYVGLGSPRDQGRG